MRGPVVPLRRSEQWVELKFYRDLVPAHERHEVWQPTGTSNVDGSLDSRKIISLIRKLIPDNDNPMRAM